VNIVGHNKIIKSLEKAFKEGKISHAYLFCGPEHIGKFCIALNFAKKITENESEINPDISVVSPEFSEKNGIIKKKDIPIESIRDIQQKISMTSVGGKFRVAVIDEAQKLSLSAQNSLLKTLEEPPQNCILILVTSDKNKLLATVVSRCQVKKFGIVGAEEMEKMIPSGYKKREELLFWSLGRPGFLKKIIEDESELKQKEEESRQFEKIFFMNLAEKFSLSEEMSKNTSSLVDKLNLWLVMARKFLLEGSCTPKISQEKTLKVINKIEESLKALRETNANARLVLDNLFLEINH